MLSFIKSLSVFICLSLSPQEAHSSTGELSQGINSCVAADNIDCMIVLKYRVSALKTYRNRRWLAHCDRLNRVPLKFTCWSANPQYLKMWSYLEIRWLHMYFVKMSSSVWTLIRYCAQLLGPVQLFVTPWTVAHQVLLRDGALVLRSKNKYYWYVWRWLQSLKKEKSSFSVRVGEQSQIE